MDVRAAAWRWRRRSARWAVVASVAACRSGASPPEPAASPTRDTPAEVQKAPSNEGAPEGWPDDLRWPSALDPNDVKVRGGAAVGWSVTAVHFEDEGAVPPARLEVWRTALDESGFLTGSSCATALPIECVVNGPASRRLRLRVDQTDHPSLVVMINLPPAGHRPLDDVALSPCVTPPERGHRIRVNASGIDTFGETFHATREREYGSYTGVDLDGDGHGERFVPVADVADDTCPWNLGWEVYVMRGACGHAVGQIVGRPTDETDVAPFVGGLRRVQTVARWGSADGPEPGLVQHTQVRTYTLQGDALALVDDTTDRAVCYHCSIPHCRVRPLAHKTPGDAGDP